MRRLALLAALALAALAPASALAQAAGDASAVRDTSCERACLLAHLDRFIAALRAGDASRLQLTGDVRFSENDVLLPLGEGLWGTVTGVDKTGLELADPVTGNAAWFGSVRENGKPAIYAVRIHLRHGLIDEIESVVHRKTALPAPFGDVEHMQHDPLFNQVLPPDERRTRERLHAIAEGYFNTVEVNDGQVLAPFAEDCARLENGISTTAAPKNGSGGNAASIMAGCENQFKLGLYRINKRIRRDIFIIDPDRGVVVARGFFDHANEFYHYKLTNGREMRTALKWPNSITLLEAFRIRNGEIQRIEAVFTYVPYFMHNPFWGPPSHPPYYAPQPDVCDAACLDADARGAMKAMVGNRWQEVNWADKVGYGENSVGIRVGEGIWATVTAVDDKPLVIADPQTGKAVWIGKIEEHGQPAWAAVTVSADGKKVGDVEALIRRKEYGPPYAEPAGAPQFDVLPEAQRTSRADMQKVFMDALRAIERHGPAPAGIAGSCRWFVNGQAMDDCMSPFTKPDLTSNDRIRDPELLAADEARGLAVYQSFDDVPATNGTGYPLTQQVVEVFHFVGGKVERIDSYMAELPYGMPPHR